jgi:4,5-dihydroxyphthalate decarboxylase
MATRITLALDRYDRHFPFFLGQLNVPPTIDLIPLEVGMVPPRRHGVDRHGRMLRDAEFDAAEVSLASYIIAKSRGAPFTAIPVFPRRLFSQNHIFVSEKSGLRHPSQLAGKRVIVWAFQVTMSVLAKGDMKRDYGLDWRFAEWLTLYPEEIAVPDLPIRQLAEGSDPVRMLLDGEAEAFIHPHPPEPAVSGRHGIRRLFEDPADECERHFKRSGYFPIMHLIAIKEATVRAAPELPRMLVSLWDEAKAIADDYHSDPGFGLSALGRLTYEQQKLSLGTDIWPIGVAANRANLARFIEDMVDQKLISQLIPIEQLFCKSTIDT